MLIKYHNNSELIEVILSNSIFWDIWLKEASAIYHVTNKIKHYELVQVPSQVAKQSLFINLLFLFKFSSQRFMVNYWIRTLIFLVIKIWNRFLSVMLCEFSQLSVICFSLFFSRETNQTGLK